MEQQQGQRTAHHQRAAQHGDPLAAGIDAVVVQYLHTGLGRAGREALPRAGHHPGQRAVGDAVHVLLCGQSPAHRRVVDAGRQRPEDQAAVDGRIGVYLRDDLQHLFRGGCGGQSEAAGDNPRVFAAFDRALFVIHVVGPLPYPQQSEAGLHAPGLQGGDVPLQAFRDGGGHRRPFEQFRHNSPSLIGPVLR